MTPLNFNAWARDHRTRHKFSRLPDPTTEEGQVFYRPWFRLFLALRATVPDVEAASERLVNEPPPRHAEHYVYLKRYVSEAVAARVGPQLAASVDDTRDTATAASKNCPRCDGGGLTSVYRAEPDPTFRSPNQVSAYCTCRLGRWVRRNHQSTSKDVRDRLVDLADVLDGRSLWVADEPLPAVSGESRR